jgi:hypothetical protein
MNKPDGTLAGNEIIVNHLYNMLFSLRLPACRQAGHATLARTFYHK